MKKKLLILAAAAMIICAALAMTACSQWDIPYDGLDRDGSTVSVRFDAGGGMFASTNGVTVVDVFNVDNYTKDASGMVYIPLVDPCDEDKREENAFEISKNGYELAGWYVTDADGKLGEKWDFASGKLKVDTSKSYTSSEPVLTLTAKWMEHTTFEFYAEQNGEMTKIGEHKGITLERPEWNVSSGKLNYKAFVKQAGKTLDEVYLDEAMTIPMSAAVSGEYDYENGIALTPVIKIYTTWREGEWIRVTKADHLINSAAADGCYELMNDIVFSDGKYWSSAFTKGEFTGKIYGNGYKISGISTTASITSKADVFHGGVFGKLGEGAELRDVTFENVTYQIENPGALAANSMLALFASADGGAVLEDVALVGAKIILGEYFATFENKIAGGQIIIGAIFADGSTSLSAEIVIESLAEGVSATVGEDGLLSFVFPEDE